MGEREWGEREWGGAAKKRKCAEKVANSLLVFHFNPILYAILLYAILCYDIFCQEKFSVYNMFSFQPT